MDGTSAKIHGEKRCWKMMDTDQGDREYFIKLTFYKDVLLCSGWKKDKNISMFFRHVHELFGTNYCFFRLSGWSA